MSQEGMVGVQFATTKERLHQAAAASQYAGAGSPPGRRGIAAQAGHGGGSSSSSRLRQRTDQLQFPNARRPLLDAAGSKASSAFKAHRISSSSKMEPSSNWRKAGTLGTA